jgi:hypothetical protein
MRVTWSGRRVPAAAWCGLIMSSGVHCYSSLQGAVPDEFGDAWLDGAPDSHLDDGGGRDADGALDQLFDSSPRDDTDGREGADGTVDCGGSEDISAEECDAGRIDYVRLYPGGTSLNLPAEPDWEPSCHLNDRVTFQAFAAYTDGHEAEVTNDCDWRSDDPTVVRSVPNTPGLFVREGLGLTRVTARYGCVTSIPALVSVDLCYPP